MKNRQVILNYLKQDPLRNIMLLKMLNAYEAAIKAIYVTVDQAAGVLLLLPTHKSAYDAQAYPATDYVVLISADNTAVTEAMLSHIPRKSNLLFKLFSEEDVHVIGQAYSIEWQRGFISFTTKPDQDFACHEEVAVLAELDEQLLPLYHENSYTTAEIQQWFAAGSAVGFAIYQQTFPVSVALAFQNYGEVWEIGALHTAVAARRQGYAQMIVETALHILHQRNKIPRYQCHIANTASRHLAEKIGLRPFLQIEHYLYAT